MDLKNCVENWEVMGGGDEGDVDSPSIFFLS